MNAKINDVIIVVHGYQSSTRFLWKNLTEFILELKKETYIAVTSVWHCTTKEMRRGK